MEFMRGTNLTDVCQWMELEEPEIVFRVGFASTRSTRITPDVDSFPGWWKSLLHQRPGEGDREDWHPAQLERLGRSLRRRRSRCQTAYVVRKEFATQCALGTMYATFCLFLLLNFLTLIEMV